MDMNNTSGLMPAGVTITDTFDTRTPVAAILAAVLDRYELNELVVQHRVQEFELLKLKEHNVDFAEFIKDHLAKSISKDIVKKISFTKKHEKDSDTHSFRGRVWVFTKEELTNMIQEIRNGI